MVGLVCPQLGILYEWELMSLMCACTMQTSIAR